MKAYIIMKDDKTMIDEPIGVCFDRDKCIEKLHKLNDAYLDWQKETIVYKKECLDNKPDWYYMKEVDILE